MHCCSNSSQRARRALQRSFAFAFLGLLCLSSVLVQGQGTSGGAVLPATSTGTNVLPTGTPVGTATGTAGGTAIGTATGTAPPLPSVSLSPMDPLGTLIMDQPKPNSVNPPLFPIGVDISFSWHYDAYLKLQPTNLTIEAYMADNTIVTIGQGLPGNLVNYTWTAEQQKSNITNPLITALYTLRIFDGAVGRFGRLPSGGYLSTYVGLKFGLYIPETYIPGNQMNPPVCATCSFSKITNAAMATVLSTVPAVAVVLSSTWLVLSYL